MGRQQGAAAALPGKARSLSPAKALLSGLGGAALGEAVGSPSDGWPHGLLRARPSRRRSGFGTLGHAGDVLGPCWGRAGPCWGPRAWPRAWPRTSGGEHLDGACGRAGRQQRAELRVRPRHLPDRPVVPAIAEAWRGQRRTASTGLRRTPCRPCLRAFTWCAWTWHMQHMLGSRTPSGPPPACARRPP